MGKQKNKKNRNTYSEDFYDMKPGYDRGRDDRPQRPRKPKVEYDPVALLIRDELVAQIDHFHNELANGADVTAASERLFTVASYPCALSGAPNANQYLVYQLERTVEASRREPDVLYLPSTILLVVDRDSKHPAFTARAFMTVDREDKTKYRAHITVYEHGVDGTRTDKTLRWSNAKPRQ